MSERLKGNIAVIDDDVLVRQSLEDCMESAGYRVRSFGSAEEFLASGSTETAACLIVDIQLPGITGLELQDKLSEADKHVPIVFVSRQEPAPIAKRRSSKVQPASFPSRSG